MNETSPRFFVGRGWSFWGEMSSKTRQKCQAVSHIRSKNSKRRGELVAAQIRAQGSEVRLDRQKTDEATMFNEQDMSDFELGITLEISGHF